MSPHPGRIDRYRQRISGPLLDRIDLHVDVPAVDFRELTASFLNALVRADGG